MAINAKGHTGAGHGCGCRQGRAKTFHQVIHRSSWKLGPTYCVPFCVATFGAYSAYREGEAKSEAQ